MFEYVFSQYIDFFLQRLMINFHSVIRDEIQVNPCKPSPCGANSNCRAIDNVAVCSCLPTYIGSPPNCRPECILNSDCDQNMSCQSHKCVNPCLQSTCGINSDCRTIGHKPVCSCRQGYTGDPFTNCVLVITTPQSIHLKIILVCFTYLL